MSEPADVPTFYAWYSAKQENMRRMDKCGTAVPSCLWYSDAEGKSVEVTMVSTTPEHGCNTEFIDDIQYRGIVVRYAGVCRK